MISDSAVVWATVVAGGLGTYAIRSSFMVVAHRFEQLPESVIRILRMIPPAALAALTLPALVRPEGELDVFNPRFAAGVVAGVIGYVTRSVLATLVAGFGTLALVEWLV